MSAQSWEVTVKNKTTGKNEDHCVFAPNPDNARTQLERRGYEVVSVKEGHFFKNVNSSAEYKNL